MNLQKILKISGSFFIGVAIIIMVLFTCNGCPDKTEKIDKSAYDSSLAEQAERNRNFQWTIDSLTILSEQKDTSIQQLIKTKDIYKDIADLQKKETDKYARMYRAARSLLDTNVMILSCDSLVDEYEILAGIHERTLWLSDSVITAQHEAIALRDTIISAQQSWIKSQVEFMAESDSSYNALYNHDYKMQRKIVRQKRLGIVAVIAAFIGGILIAK
jgi:hypothetical protein